MSDLAKHLREIASGTVSVDYGDLRAYCDKTADEIERLEAELAEARREREALRAAIEQAPHKLSCEWWSNKVTQEFSAAPDAMHRNCTCWKRAALEGTP